MIVTPQNAAPRCDATVELLSKVFRPFLFMVTVTGQPPHRCTRRYQICAPSEDSAAIKGLELFVKEFSPAIVADDMATQVPKAKLS